MSAGAGQTTPADRATPRYSDNWSRRVMVFRDGIGQAGDMQAEDLDDLVQHLAVAKYALEADETARAAEALDAAMIIARRGPPFPAPGGCCPETRPGAAPPSRWSAPARRRSSVVARSAAGDVCRCLGYA